MRTIHDGVGGWSDGSSSVVRDYLFCGVGRRNCRRGIHLAFMLHMNLRWSDFVEALLGGAKQWKSKAVSGRRWVQHLSRGESG
jgi:hypothetical protein